MRRIIICFIALCNVLIANAYHYDSNPSAINGNILQTSMTTEVTNFDFQNLANNSSFYLENPFGLVQIERTNGTTPIKVSFQLNYYYVYNGVLNQKSELVTLNLEGDKKINYLKAVGALKLGITNLTITGNANDFKFTSTCRGERFDLFTQSTVKVSSLTKDVSKVSTNGHLIVSWQEKLGDVTTGIKPEAYELEWTYLSEIDINKAYLRDYAFQNNSSRVVLTNSSYQIPLVYEKGIIVYRVRAIGYAIINKDLTLVRTPWSLEDKSTSLEESISVTSIPENNYYIFDGLETNMNWQSTITFAEEGKNKAVVSYHDGTLRNRQALTRVNTDQRVVVGETYYDFNGRPVIQILPVPDAKGTDANASDKNSFYYRPGFNKDANGNELTKFDYEDFNCDSYSAEQLSDGSGASMYYSDKNGFENDASENVGGKIINRNLIADAEKYPYTQIRYRADNTDRVVAQSGVGAAHRMGSGHETKYLYGAPSQSEITRLFGTQVGNSAFYKKNAVIDPNGQVSVSYLNPEGKVVATALAGEQPEKLDKIGSDTERKRSIKDELITNATNQTTGNQIVFNQPFPVSTKTTYDFKYELEAKPFNLICQHPDPAIPAMQISVVGAYDVELKLTDKKCTKTIFTEYVTTNGGLSKTSSEKPAAIEKSILLDVGEYTLQKTLILNEAKLKEFLNIYELDNNYTCVAREQYFIGQANTLMNTSFCGLSCDGCSTRVGQFINQVEQSGSKLSELEKVNLLSVCDLMCAEVRECQNGLLTMLADLNVDGQYAQITVGRAQQEIPKLSSGEFPNQEMANKSADQNIKQTNAEVANNTSGEPSTKPEIKPENFPLSIFNPTNSLKISGFLYLATNDKLITPNWKRPVKIKVSNGTNPVISGNTNTLALKSIQQGSQISYDSTDYYNEAGEPAYRVVQCLSGNCGTTSAVYDIALDANAPLEKIGETNLYNVKIKYIKDFKVFVKEWKSSYAAYFVPYHPEFAYYESCMHYKELIKYKEGLDLLQTSSDFTDEKFFKKVEDNDNVFWLEPQFISKDPFFTSSLLSQTDRNTLSSKFSSYEAGKSMIQKANELVHCTGLLCNSTSDLCTTNKGKIKAGDEEVLQLVKGMYLAQRTALIKQYMHKYAIGKMSYNVCVGADGYMSHADKQFFLKNSASQPVEVLNKVNTFLKSNDGKTKVGKYIRRKVAAIANFVFPPKIIFIPMVNPLQICSSPNYEALYKNQRKVFLQEIAGYESLSHPEISCQRYQLGSNAPNDDWYNSGCYMNTNTQITRAQDYEYLLAYNSCKDCPIKQDLDLFLASVFDGNGVEPNQEKFNCQDNGNESDLSLGKYLTEQLSNSVVLLDWERSFNFSNKKFEATLKTTTGNLSPQQVKIEIDMSNLLFKTGVSNATDVFKLLDYIKVSKTYVTPTVTTIQMYFEVNPILSGYSTLTNPTKGIDFTNVATQASNPNIKYFEFPITIKVGASSTSLSDLPLTGNCPIPSHCGLGDFAQNVKMFLNDLTLSYSLNNLPSIDNINSSPSTISKSSVLTSSSSFPIESFSEQEQSGLAMIGYQPEDIEDVNDIKLIEVFEMLWQKVEVFYTTTGFDFTGKLTFKDEFGQSGSYIIDIKDVSGQSLDFPQIAYFDNLRPFEVSADTNKSKKMYADAFVNTGNNIYKIYPVVIQLNAVGSAIQHQLTTGCINQTQGN